MRYFDLGSWQGILSTLFGLAVFTLICGGIRKALDLEPIPDDVAIPRQGPTRQTDAKAKGGKGDAEKSGGGGGGMGGGMGLGLSSRHDPDNA